MTLDTYWFTLTLERVLTDADENAAFAEGCSDGTFYVINGRQFVDFAREARSPTLAVVDARRALARAGLRARRVSVVHRGERRPPR